MNALTWKGTKGHGKVLLPMAVVLLLTTLSVIQARRIADDVMREEVAPPPYYSTQFVLNPDHCMEGAVGTGLQPGWVISYVAPHKLYGTAICVSLFGKVLATGTPTIVVKEQKIQKKAIDEFCTHIQEAESTISLGMSYSNVVARLGMPFMSDTNRDLILAYYRAEPRVPFSGFITNGFQIILSNELVISKNPITCGSH